MPTPLLAMQHISKSFPGVRALSDVSFEIKPGEVHALVGENGAGKSTLMKILAGVHQPDTGTLHWEGQPVTFRSTTESQQRGISIIYQEFNLLPDLTVAENVMLNREPRNRLGLIDWRALNQRTEDLLRSLDADIDPRTPVAELSVAQQQLVEIVKALVVQARLLIMDEPTAALNPTEVGNLFKVIARLKAQGSSMIFISHRLDEVFSISDTITVLKDGHHVSTSPAADLTREEVVRRMVGRQLQDIFPPRLRTQQTQPILEVRGLSNQRLRSIDLRLYAGEILGLAGLEGHGQRELARTLFGIEPIHQGQIFIHGQPVSLRHPSDAMQRGIAFLSDDRKVEGLALTLCVRENVALPNLNRFSRITVMQPRSEQIACAQMVETLSVKTPGLEQPVRLLSGGNQQKTVLSKWLIGEPRILIFVEPTRGIDVGAKVEIYKLIHRLASEGAAVVIVSSELLELLGLSSRVLVLREGTITAELPGDTATEESIMLAATGIHTMHA
jgi:ABC-type sugar transport system ATPase subunit